MLVLTKDYFSTTGSFVITRIKFQSPGNRTVYIISNPMVVDETGLPSLFSKKIMLY